MDGDRDDREALRRRLYRPGAAPADLAAYLRAADTDRATEPRRQEDDPHGEPGTSLRPFVLGTVLVAGAALVGGLLLASAAGARSAADGTGSTTAVPTTAAPADVGTLRPDGSSEITFAGPSVLDGGRRSGAEGDAVADGPERYRYTVADGDTVSGIAARFALCRADVIQSLPYGYGDGSLPAGGSLELGHVSGLC